MTTATPSNTTTGSLYLRGADVNEALAWRGLNVLDDGRLILCLTGYAPGIAVEIVFQNPAELIGFRDALNRIIDIEELDS